MQNENTPAEGTSSDQTDSESALRGATCSASSVFTADEWMKLYNEAAAAHLDVQAALKRLVDAHTPRPLVGIIDDAEREWDRVQLSVERLEATTHARKTLRKYDPFSQHNDKVEARDK